MTTEERLTALEGIVTAQATEIRRQAEMIQTLSESHDQNRRELQAATKSAKDFTAEMEQHVSIAAALRAEMVEERKQLSP